MCVVCRRRSSQLSPTQIRSFPISFSHTSQTKWSSRGKFSGLSFFLSCFTDLWYLSIIFLMSYFEKLQTSRNRRYFPLPQPHFSQNSGIQCKHCPHDLVYFAPKKKNLIGLAVSSTCSFTTPSFIDTFFFLMKCHHPSHKRPIFLTLFVDKFIQDLNQLNKACEQDSPPVVSPYHSPQQKTKYSSYKSPGHMQAQRVSEMETGGSGRKTSTSHNTVCTGIIVNGNHWNGQAHTLRGHRHCPHHACPSVSLIFLFHFISFFFSLISEITQISPLLQRTRLHLVFFA